MLASFMYNTVHCVYSRGVEGFKTISSVTGGWGWLPMGPVGRVKQEPYTGTEVFWTSTASSRGHSECPVPHLHDGTNDLPYKPSLSIWKIDPIYSNRVETIPVSAPSALLLQRIPCSRFTSNSSHKQLACPNCAGTGPRLLCTITHPFLTLAP